MNDTMKPSLPASPAPRKPAPADLLTATSLKREKDEESVPVAVDDIVAAMRRTLAADNLPDFETMLAAQAVMMNAAFNRLLPAGLAQNYGSYGSGQIDAALRAQRRVCD